LDNDINLDLKELMEKSELVQFMDQLNIISPSFLAVLDKNGAVIYKNPDTKESNKIVAKVPINVNSSNLGILAGYQKNDPVSAEYIQRISEIIGDRLKKELEADSLALEVINSYQEMNLIYELSDNLSGILDSKAICDTVLKHAVEIIDPKKAFIMLLDKNKKNLTITASTEEDKSIQDLIIRVEGSIYESVINDINSLVIENVENNLDLKSKIQRYEKLLSVPLICVPINVKDEVFGLISMSEKNSGRPFTSADNKLLCAIASQTGMSLGNAKLYQELNLAFLNTVEALAAAVEAKDPHMHGHCRRVASYVVEIGKEMGLPSKDIIDLRLAGILHDIGKIGISELILKKASAFRLDEMEEMKTHSAKGAEIIEHIEPMKRVANWIRHHHERYDGAGYPDELKGQDIPLHSRILAVADAYDNFTSSRNYQSKYPYDIPLVKLQISSGSKFDPEIVNIFLNLIREDAYQKYLKKCEEENINPDKRLSRIAYYRVDSEISGILIKEASGDTLSEFMTERLEELRESVLR